MSPCQELADDRRPFRVQPSPKAGPGVSRKRRRDWRAGRRPRDLSPRSRHHRFALFGAPPPSIPCAEKRRDVLACLSGATNSPLCPPAFAEAPDKSARLRGFASAKPRRNDLPLTLSAVRPRIKSGVGRKALSRKGRGEVRRRFNLPAHCQVSVQRRPYPRALLSG
jgi:hypothetical protein